MVSKNSNARGAGSSKAGAGGAGPGRADSVKESAQQIWLAGLGAFSKAQTEGGQVFEALVRQGLELQRQTQAVTQGKIAEASAHMANAANEISNRAAGQWDRLETIFEDRVAKALHRLGVPSASQIAQINGKLDALGSRLDQLLDPAGKRRPAAKTGAPAKPTARVSPGATRRRTA